MNTVTRSILLTVVSVLCLPLNSPAQETANSLEIFGQFGASFLTDLKPDIRTEILTLPEIDPTFRLVSTSERSIGKAGRFSGGFRWYVQKGRAFEVSYSHSNNSFWTRSTLETDPPSPFINPIILESSGQLKFRNVAFSYVQYLKPLKSWEPFFTVGLGLGVNNQAGSSIILGAGADYRLSRHLKLRFDFRDYAGVGSLPGGTGSNGIFHNLVPSVGLVYTIAGPKAPPEETGEPRFDVFVQGGPSFMTGKTLDITSFGDPVFFTVTERTSFTTSGRLFTGFRYYLTPKNAIEVSHFFSRNRFVLQVETTISPIIFPFPFPSPSPSTFSFKVSNSWVDGGAINLVHYLSTKGRQRWFITSGIGVSFFNFGSEATTHEFAMNFGGGVDIPLSPRLSLRMEMRDWILQKPIRPGATHNLTPSAGLAWRF